MVNLVLEVYLLIHWTSTPILVNACTKR